MNSLYKGNRILIGPPGTGKTRFLADRVPRIVESSGVRLAEDRSPVLICSLTRTAAREIGSRVPDLPRAATATIHAHGFRSQGRPPVVERDHVLGDWNRRYPAFAITPPGDRDIVGDIVAVRRGRMPGDELASEYDRGRQRLIPRDRTLPRVQTYGKYWERWKRELGVIDFTDMLERASSEPPLGAEVIIIDEAQDCSRLAWQVVNRWGEGRGLIAVGDPWQALYDPWAGADASILTDPAVAADHRGVLKQSRRVPVAVHRYAMSWIRRLSGWRPIEYFPRRENCDDPSSPFVEGTVTRCFATRKDPDPAIQQAEELAAAGESVLFLFSANYMTAPLCAELRTRSLVFSNPWRPGEPLWNPLRSDEASGIRALLGGEPWTHGALHSWLAPLRAHDLLRPGAKARPAECADGEADAEGGPIPVSADQLQAWLLPGAFQEFRALLAAGDAAAILEWWLARLLPTHRRGAEYAARLVRRHGAEVLVNPPLLHPSTIHACKGGEADHVFLFPDLSPAAAQAWVGGPQQRDAIVRAFYVGITRARVALHICLPGGGRFVDL